MASLNVGFAKAQPVGTRG